MTGRLFGLWKDKRWLYAELPTLFFIHILSLTHASTYTRHSRQVDKFSILAMFQATLIILWLISSNNNVPVYQLQIIASTKINFRKKIRLKRSLDL